MIALQLSIACESYLRRMYPRPATVLLVTRHSSLVTRRSAISSTESVQQQFGAVAAAYVTSSYHANGADLGELLAACEFTGAEHVLDLGSGAGHAALRVAPAVADVVGVDVTVEMVAVAAELARTRHVGNARFEQADVTRLPFPDASFDAITSRQSAHHYSDLPRALSEAFRVLRPGGRFVIVDTVAPEDPALDTFLNCFELLRDASHVRDWRGSEWLRMLSVAGFESAEVLSRYGIPLEGDAWVQRMRTPPQKVETIKTLFREATAAQRNAFELHMDDPWGLSVPSALFRVRKPA